MLKRYILFAATHLVATALTLNILSLFLPCFITHYYECVANILLCLIVAKLTFGFTKKHFLTERIQPDNRAVFITGCDTGFGHGIAKQLDTIGFHVFSGCLFPEGEGAQELKKRCSKRLQIVKVDVTNDESVKAAADFVKENLGTSELWAIINNAGILKGFSVELTQLQDFKDCLEVNTLGPVRVTKAFLPLIRQSKGRVINLSSLGGRIATSHFTPYIMSKFATVGFTSCLRQEMDVWGVRVISVEPDFFRTPLTKSENVSKLVDQSFATIDEEVKADYGEMYFKNFKLFWEYKLSMSSPKVHIVLDALEMAVSLQYPDPVYTPCASVVRRIFASVHGSMPVVMQDLITNFRCTIMGLPKPKEADNNL